MTAAGDHCLEAVRQGDSDRFLSTLFAPDDRRPHLLALYAFNVEVVRIRDVVSDPQVGRIRQQWWLDTLDGIYASETQAHPVAQALAGAIAAAGLPQAALRNLIAAREFDLYDDPMPDLVRLEGYLGETSSALIQMAAMILAGREAENAAEAAGLAGVAYGLAGLLRMGPVGLRYLPPGMDVAAAVAHAARRLDEARALRSRIPAAALPAFLPASLTGLYLSRIARSATGGLTKPVEVSRLRRQLAMWRAARRDRF